MLDASFKKPNSFFYTLQELHTLDQDSHRYPFTKEKKQLFKKDIHGDTITVPIWDKSCHPPETVTAFPVTVELESFSCCGKEENMENRWWIRLIDFSCRPWVIRSTGIGLSHERLWTSQKQDKAGCYSQMVTRRGMCVEKSRDGSEGYWGPPSFHILVWYEHVSVARYKLKWPNDS